MTDFGVKILFRTDKGQERGNQDTKIFLTNLKYVFMTLPDKSSTIPMEDYTKEIRHLREATYSIPAIVTPIRVNTEELDPELA